MVQMCAQTGAMVQMKKLRQKPTNRFDYFTNV